MSCEAVRAVQSSHCLTCSEKAIDGSPRGSVHANSAHHVVATRGHFYGAAIRVHTALQHVLEPAFFDDVRRETAFLRKLHPHTARGAAASRPYLLRNRASDDGA